MTFNKANLVGLTAALNGMTQIITYVFLCGSVTQWNTDYLSTANNSSSQKKRFCLLVSVVFPKNYRVHLFLEITEVLKHIFRNAECNLQDGNIQDLVFSVDIVF